MNRAIAFALFLLPSLSLSSVCGGDDDSVVDIALANNQSDDTIAIHRKRNGTVEKRPWKTVVGKRVTVQGIAWNDSKGLGDRVILDGTTLYVDAKTPFKKPGRLVELTGILEKRRMPAAPPGAQGYPVAFDYYVVSNATGKQIEVASEPYAVVTEE